MEGANLKAQCLAVFSFLMVVAANNAAAFPVVKGSTLMPSAPSANRIIGPASLENFEELIGHQLTSSEISQIQRISDQTRALNEDDSLKPQKVRWDLGSSGYEFTVLICGQFKMQADAIIPQKVKDVLGKLPAAIQSQAGNILSRGTVELMPCFDPHTKVSYVMVGGSHTVGAPSILSAGLTVGIYFSPKAENMVIGSYVFGRFTWNVYGMGKLEVTGGGDVRCAQDLAKMEFDFSNCRRFFISTGLGFDLGGAIFSKLKALRKQANAASASEVTQGKAIDLGMWSFSYGVIVKVHEFPWYERMRNGMGLKETFGDIAGYTAQN